MRLSGTAVQLADQQYKPEAQASGYFQGFPGPSLARRACIGTLRFFNFHVFYQLECEILSQMCNFKERKRELHGSR